MELSQQQIDTFFGLGYLILEDLFTPEEVAVMGAALQRLEQTARGVDEPTTIGGSVFIVERIVEAEPLQPRAQGEVETPETGNTPARSTHRIHRIQWAGAAEPVLATFGEDPRIVHPACQLLGSSAMDHLINQVHYKFPFDGVAFPWHQDSQFRRFGTPLWEDRNGRGSFVQVAIAIDPMTADNGPLQCIPYSCQWGHLGLDQMAQMAQMAQATPQTTQRQLTVDYAIPPQLSAQYQLEEAVTITLSAGSVLLFGPYMIHRSLPNTGTLPRRVLINGYAYPGANHRQYPGEGAGRRIQCTHARHHPHKHPKP